MVTQGKKSHPFIAENQIVIDICKPLFKAFDLRSFSHIRVNEKYQYTGIISKKEWAEFYVKNNLQHYDVMSFNLDHYPEQCIVWSENHLHSAIENTVRKYACEQDLGSGITLTFRNGNIRDFFGFAASTDNKSINKILATSQNELSRFIFYYLEQTSKIKRLSNIYHDWQEMDILQHRNDSCYIVTATQEDRHKLDLYPKRYYISDKNREIYLTQAQMKCLALGLNNKTSKEIAKILHISHRTVQEHLDNIRKKIVVSNIKMLYEHLKNNDYIRQYCALFEIGKK